ncbi:MAG: GumC family protein [candidate division KSB1 bacterium]
MLVYNSNLLSLRDGLQAIFRNRTLVLLVFALTVVPVGIATFTAKNIYRTKAKVLVRRESRPAALNPYFSRLDQEEDIRSELEIATSRPVLENVLYASWAQGKKIEHFDQPDISSRVDESGTISEKMLDQFRQLITVEAVTGSNVIEISFDDADPVRAAWFANALANAYVAYNAQVHGGAGAENFLKERIAEARSRLDSLDRTLTAYRASTGLAAHSKQENMMYEKYRSADQQLAQLREKAELLTDKIHRLRQVYSAGDSLVIPTVEMDSHPSVRMLYTRLTELRLERNALAEKYQVDHRLVADLNKQIASVQTALIAEVDRLLSLENERLNSLHEEELVVSRAVAVAKSAINALPEKERIFDELELASENARKVYSLLVMRREEMSVENATDRRLSRITVISPAGVPSEPISPRRGRNMILSVIIGILAALASGLVREYFNGTFKSPHELALALEVPVLGVISAEKKSKLTYSFDDDAI